MTEKPSKSGGTTEDVPEANGREPDAVARRGKEDRVHRLRSQVWFCLVQAHKKTPDQPADMDAFFLGDRTLGGRVSQRIRDNASDPGRPRTALGNDSVAGRVGAKAGYLDTLDAYNSALWTLLGPEPMEPEERELLIRSLLRKFALYESGPDDAFIFRALGMLDFRGLKRTRGDFRRALRVLASKRSVDRILLLCLFYRRYLESGRWGEARDVRDAVIRAIRHFCNRPGFHADVETLWLFITRRRVFAGQPSLEHTWQALFEARELLAGWEARCSSDAEHAWFMQQVWLYACVRENAEETPAPSLIPRDLEVEQFLSRRSQMMVRALEAAADVWHGAPPDLDAPVSAATRFAEMAGHRE